MRNKNVIKLVLTLLTLTMCMVTIYTMVNTYAIFYSEVEGSLSRDLAKWNIEINNETISMGIVRNFIIDQFYVTDRVHVQDNKFAPGTSGYFEITIDPKDTQVSLRYDISMDLSQITNGKIQLTSVEETLDSNTMIQTAENTYTAIIPLQDIHDGYKNNIKVSFNWENDESNNTEDTNIGIVPNPKIIIPVTVKVTQYLNEIIVPI